MLFNIHRGTPRAKARGWIAIGRISNRPLIFDVLFNNRSRSTVAYRNDAIALCPKAFTP